MIRVDFTEQDLQAITYERYHHPVPRVQRRMEVLWLKSQGFSHKQIAKLAGVCQSAVTKYLRLYHHGGLDGVRKVNFYRPKSELEQYSESIEQYFRDNPVASISEAAATIEQLTGIRRSKSQVHVFLRRLGLRPRKVGSLPAGADPVEQEQFKKESLEPILKEAKKGKRYVFFMDAAHFVFAPFLGFLWCFARVFVKARSGRKRFNVLGALNAITHEVITVTNETYINASSVCDLLIKIAEACDNRPISIILDNAKYQKCALVQDMADSLDIELVYLPPYSPNLNLIERLWKFVKRKSLYSKYYDDFTSFSRAISLCLSKTNTDYKKELDPMLSLNFQSFSESHFVAR